MRRLAGVGLSALAGVLVAAVAWAIGVPLRQSAVLAACVIVLGAGRVVAGVQQTASSGERWRGRWTLTPGGARRDVRQLGWRMRADHGRVHGAAVQRLRHVAAQTLQRHGIDLADPARAADAEALLGSTAYRVVTVTHDRAVRYAAFVEAVTALERLAPTPRPAAPTSSSTPQPEHR